jgi:hypothetical protein
MSAVLDAAGVAFDASADVLIIGAGAAGLCAALAAREGGAEVVVVERDRAPRGSTALSAGLIPAAATRFQRERGIADDPDAFARDIQRKAHDEADPVSVGPWRDSRDRPSSGSPTRTACHSPWCMISTIPAMAPGACTDCLRARAANSSTISRRRWRPLGSPC